MTQVHMATGEFDVLLQHEFEFTSWHFKLGGICSKYFEYAGQYRALYVVISRLRYVPLVVCYANKKVIASGRH